MALAAIAIRRVLPDEDYRDIWRAWKNSGRKTQIVTLWYLLAHTVPFFLIFATVLSLPFLFSGAYIIGIVIVVVSLLWIFSIVLFDFVPEEYLELEDPEEDSMKLTE